MRLFLTGWSVFSVEKEKQGCYNSIIEIGIWSDKVKDIFEIKVGCLCALACETLFGFGYLFTKNATATASELSLLGWRFLLAVVVMGICAATGIVKINLRRKGIKPLLLVALFSPVLVTVFAVGISSSLSILGYAVLLVAVVSYALYSVFVEKAEAYTGEEITFVMLLAGAVVSGILAIIESIF